MRGETCTQTGRRENMITFIIGLFIGACIGIMTMAIMNAGRDD